MSNVELMKDQVRVMREEGAEAVAARYRDDAVYLDNARGLTLKGKEEITAMVRDWKQAFPDIRAEDAEYFDAGDWTIARFQGRAPTTASSVPFRPRARRWTSRSASCSAGRMATSWRVPSTTTPPRS